jgi:hypothetical protein
MLIGKMDFPDRLLDAQKDGSLVIFAGAGVSMPPPSNFPNFDDLANQVAGGVLHREEHEPVDRFLGRLIQRGVKVHDRVRQILSDPDSAPNSMHSDLFRLFPTPAVARLVTTNFDLHFTRAARSLFDIAEMETFSAPALPLGDSFSGLVYLHGSIDKSPERLVLTDADFGRAYLTEGWARHFLQRLFAKYIVMFIGYSHNDPVMNYLARGLPPEVESPRRFSLVPEGDNDRWRFLGITPVPYTLTYDQNRYSVVGSSLARWVEFSRAAALEQEQKIKSIAERPVPIDPEELAYIEHAFKEASTVRFFTRYANGTDWLRWVEGKGFLKGLFSPGAAASAVDVELAYWFASRFLCEHPGEALAVIRREGQSPGPFLWTTIARHLHAKKPKPKPRILGLWIPLLLGCRPAGGTHEFLDYMLHDSGLPDNENTSLLLFEHLTRPAVLHKEDLWAGADDQSGDETVRIEIETEGKYYWLFETWQKVLRPNLERLADKLLWIANANLQRAYLLLRAHDPDSTKFDSLSYSRKMIESTAQGSPEDGVGVLIEVARESLEWNIANDPARADFWIETWSRSGYPLFRRLAIFGIAQCGHWPPDKKIEWLLENDLLYGFAYKHEVYLVLQNAYPQASERSRVTVLERAVEGSRADIGETTKEYEIYNLLYWLTHVAPDCPETKARFGEFSRKHPEFGPREHPDMGSWIGKVKVGWESPITAAELLSKPPEEQLDFLISFRPADPMGASREGLLHELRKGIAIRYSWGMELLDALKRRGSWEPDLLKAVVDAWGQADLAPAQWDEVLRFLLEADGVIPLVAHEASHLLENGISRSSNAIPDEYLHSAIQLSEKLWSVCASSDDGKQETADDWLTVAINHPAGNLAEFVLRVLSRLRTQSADPWQGIAPEHKRFLESILNGCSYSAELGRVVLASQLHFFFSLDEKWMLASLLPLLDWASDSRRALQAWHGFLTWGRWTHNMLPHLLPFYESAFPKVDAEFGKFQRNFCEHLAGIACFSTINPLQHGWLNGFLVAAGLEQRIMWAAAMGGALGQMKEPGAQVAWDHWIQTYWQNRIEGLPVPLDSREVGEMVEWSIPLQSVFPAAVTKICASPNASMTHSSLFYRLPKSEIPALHPAPAAKLVLHLLRTAEFRYYDVDSIIQITERLAASGVDRTDLRLICDELARLGYPGARELRDAVDRGNASNRSPKT